MLRPLLALLALPFLLSGCGSTASLENRAYVLLLGADVTAEGGVALSAVVPRVGSASGQDKGSGDGSPYLTFSARGAGFVEALENLEWAVPRKLSLSHILLLALSEDAARSERCPALIDAIMQTRSLYAEARVAVCAGSAADFVQGMTPAVEPRLSSEFAAILARNAAKGYSAEASLADLYYAAHSDYGDAVSAWAGGAPQAEGGGSPILVPDADGAGQTHGEAAWLGGAAFREGRLALTLDARDCVCVGLASGSLKEVTLDSRGTAAALSVTGARHEVSWGAGGAKVRLSISLTPRDALSRQDAAALEDALAAAILSAMTRCQAAGVEPFGFTEVAARRFVTQGAWRQSGWRDAWRAAEAEAQVSIR